MEQPQITGVQTSEPMSALSGVLKVLFQPRVVFASLQSKPNWVLPLVIFLVLTVVATVILYPIILSDILANISSNPDFTEEQRGTAVEQVTSRLSLPVIAVPGILYQAFAFFAIAAVFFFVANILLGGEGKFVQMLSVTGLSLLVSIPEDLIKVPMILAKKTMKIHTDLALFLPSSMEDNLFYNLLSHLDIFNFWKVYLIGLGMAVLYKFSLKKSMTAGFVVWGVYILTASMLGKFLSFGMK